MGGSFIWIKISSFIWIIVRDVFNRFRLYERKIFKTVHTCTYMSKTISLTNEAYDLLKSMKLKKGKLSEVLFLYPELQEAEEFEKAVRENRKATDIGF